MGSSPSDAAEIRNAISQPLKYLLNEIGYAVVFLNTSIVGLDAVEEGYQKPDSLNISWNPHDRESTARKARTFLLECVLIRAVAAINEFFYTLDKLPRFRALKRKNKESNANRVKRISTNVLGKDHYLIPGVVLAVHWRNRIVHHHRSKGELKSNEKRVLLANKDTISDRFKGLDVFDLLEHFKNRSPTLKDVSSLIAMTIRLAKGIHEGMQSNISKEDLSALLEYYDLYSDLEKVKRENSPNRLDSAIKNMFMSKAPCLVEAYFEHRGVLSKQD